MEQIFSLIAGLDSVIDASDLLYQKYDGAPTENSKALLEIIDHDEELAVSTGLPRPLFGAYADAEFKLRLLNDLVRSFTSLATKSEINFGEMVVARSTIEVAARMRWGLAISDQYPERASRWLRERLRIIGEAKKLGSVPRAQVEEFGNEAVIIDAAVRAGLNVPGPPPGAIDLVGLLMSNTSDALRFQGLNREELVAIFYRKLSAVTHGSSLGIQSQLIDPRNETSPRSSTSDPAELLTLIAGVLIAYVNAHGALTELYGWDASPIETISISTAVRINDAFISFTE